MTAKYKVSVNYNGVWKDYFFESRKEARDFMYKQECKGCNPRNILILHIG